MSLGRRNFLKVLGFGVGAAAAAPIVKKAEAVEKAVVETGLMTEPKPEPPGLLGHDKYGSGTLPQLDHVISPGSGRIWDTGVAINPKNYEGNYKGLKPDPTMHDVDYSFFMNDIAEKGSVVTYCGDVECQACVCLQKGNDPPAGILLNDVVNIDVIGGIPHSHETMQGGKVSVLRRGTIITKPVGDPRPGDHACAHDSYISNNNPAGVRIGTFLTGKDEDGFAKISVDHI